MNDAPWSSLTDPVNRTYLSDSVLVQHPLKNRLRSPDRRSENGAVESEGQERLDDDDNVTEP